MTITTTAIKAVGQGDGANTTWPYAFLIPASGDLVVTLVNNTSGNETVLNPLVYTATGIGNPTGGAVTYPLSGSPVAVGFSIVVERFVPDTQTTDLTNQGAVYPQDIEDALDYITMITQQLQDQIDRAIVFSVADTVETTLPVASARANLALVFDSSGRPIAGSGITPGTTVSAAMIPVVTAPTTADALTALGLPGALLDLLIPSGTEWDYNAAGAAPTGFVYPIGQPCISLYPDYRAKLIAAGSPYGNNGVDPLMPDKRSVVNAGKSNMGGVDNGLLPGGTVLGALLGNATRTLIGSNLPAYTPSGSVASPVTNGTSIQKNTGLFISSVVPAGGTAGLFADVNALSRVTVTVTSTFTGAAQGGTSVPFAIVQPTMICNKILKVH